MYPCLVCNALFSQYTQQVMMMMINRIDVRVFYLNIAQIHSTNVFFFLKNVLIQIQLYIKSTVCGEIKGRWSFPN